MRSGNSDIFVAGDLANFPFPRLGATTRTRIEHWDVAYDQGRIAAVNMLAGDDASRLVPYDGVPFFWTASFGKSLRYAGHCHAADAVIIHGSTSPVDTASFVAYYCVRDAVVAVATLSKDPYAVAAMELLRLDAMPTPAVLGATTAFDLVAHLQSVEARSAAGGGGAGAGAGAVAATASGGGARQRATAAGAGAAGR